VEGGLPHRTATVADWPQGPSCSQRGSLPEDGCNWGSDTSVPPPQLAAPSRCPVFRYRAPHSRSNTGREVRLGQVAQGWLLGLSREHPDCHMLQQQQSVTQQAPPQLDGLPSRALQTHRPLSFSFVGSRGAPALSGPRRPLCLFSRVDDAAPETLLAEAGQDRGGTCVKPSCTQSVEGERLHGKLDKEHHEAQPPMQIRRLTCECKEHPLKMRLFARDCLGSRDRQGHST
jgi:hypothetical protein